MASATPLDFSRDRLLVEDFDSGGPSGLGLAGRHGLVPFDVRLLTART